MAEAMTSSAPPAADVDADPATYEQLAQLELSLDTIDNRLVSIQNHLSTPIYDQRSAVIRKIPNFWPLVFEQAPPDIDQYIQPSDSAVFAACLKDITVERFEIPESLPADPYAPVTVWEEHDDKAWGEPRSIKFTFEFSTNEWFEDTKLEKKFWFRRAKDGWSGRVSEPVKIHWKKGKDLTDGLLDAAVALGAAEKKAKAADGAAGEPGNGKGKEKVAELPEAVAMKKLLESSAGNLSFFTWFGYRGRSVTAEESAEAWEKLKKGEKPTAQEDDEEDEDEDLEDLMEDLDTEIFPDGEDLAVALAEDLWPGAIRYFTQAQEEDYISDIEFEDHEMGDEEDEDDVPDIRSLVKDSQRSNGPPSKKRKT